MSETKALQIVKSIEFEGVRFDCYQGSGSEFYGTREQIGMMLEYSDPRNAIDVIHKRNKGRLDNFSTTVKLSVIEGNRTVTRSVIAYSFKGLLEICRYSSQPRANAVIDFLWDVADSIRKTGSYSPEGNSDKFRLMVSREKTARLRVDTARARLLLKMADDSNKFLTPESRLILYHEGARLLAGHELPAMLPNVVEKLYNNESLAKELGITSREIMKTGRALEIIAAEGEVSKYGTWKRTKSPHSAYECNQWYWKEAGRTKILENYGKQPYGKEPHQQATLGKQTGSAVVPIQGA
jgi:prophage antirepressor-like protein